MIRRFQIEDIIVQDSSGVVYRALDTETGKMVAVRRFFPFGVDGGGLQPDEQEGYNIAIERLAGVSHPALRAVVCGGCDPVDGMPFIATEWVEGDTLLTYCEQGTLAPENAAEMLTSALEVSELLSQVLADEAVWVDTDLQSIIVGNPDSGRRYTFWISPLKWLGTGGEPRGLESIVHLTEQVMGWDEETATDHANTSLGGWLHSLRTSTAATRLHQAREALAAAFRVAPPAVARQQTSPARVPSRPAAPAKLSKPAKRKKNVGLILINSLLAISVICLGAWLWLRKHPENRFASALFPNQQTPLESVEPPSTAPVSAAKESSAAVHTEIVPPSPESSLSEEAKRQRANELAAQLSVKNTTQNSTKPAPNPKPAPTTDPAVIQWDNHDLLAKSHGQSVIVEGVVAEVGQSQTGKTIYLLFANKQNRNAARAGIKVEIAQGDAMKEKLKPFLTQKIRVTGTVDLQTTNGLKRPDIMIQDLSALQIVP